jgi:hypothetical protein
MHKHTSTRHGLMKVLVAASLPLLMGLSNCPPSPNPPPTPVASTSPMPQPNANTPRGCKTSGSSIDKGGLLAPPVCEANLPFPRTSTLQWYGAVHVSAQLATGPGTSTTLDNATATNWLAGLGRAFGINSGQKHFAFTVTPTIKTVKTPTLTPIQVDHISSDGNGGEQVTVTVANSLFSPWFPLDDGSTVTLNVVDVASNQSTFNLMNNVSGLFGDVVANPAFALSTVAGNPLGIARAAMSLAANPIDNILNSSLTFKTDSNWTTTDFVLGNGTPPGTGQPGGYDFTLTDGQGHPIAFIQVQYVFRRSLRFSPEPLSVDKDPDLHDKPLNSPSYQAVQADGSTATIDNILHQTGPNRTMMGYLEAQSPTPSDFFNNCGTSYASVFEGLGFNLTDSVFYRVSSLAPVVNRSGNEALAQGFWDNCMQAGDRAIARIINVEGAIHAAVPVTLASVQQLGNFIVKKGIDPVDAGTVQGMLAPALNFQVTTNPATPGPLKPMTPAAAMQQPLIQLPTRSGSDAFYCIVQPGTPANPADDFVWTLFLAAPATPAPPVDQILALDTGPGDSSAQISLITLRPPTKTEFDNCKKRRPAASPPQGPEPAN